MTDKTYREHKTIIKKLKLTTSSMPCCSHANGYHELLYSIFVRNFTWGHYDDFSKIFLPFYSTEVFIFMLINVRFHIKYNDIGIGFNNHTQSDVPITNQNKIFQTFSQQCIYMIANHIFYILALLN